MDIIHKIFGLLPITRRRNSCIFHLYDRQPVNAENGICQLMADNDRHQFMVFLLFSGEKQYGLLACDIQPEEFPFFYVISLQIGLSLHYLEISKVEVLRRQEMSRDLELVRERNRELGLISKYDELTGLLNLRGFTATDQEFLQQKRTSAAPILSALIWITLKKSMIRGDIQQAILPCEVSLIFFTAVSAARTSLPGTGGCEFLILLNCQKKTSRIFSANESGMHVLLLMQNPANHFSWRFLLESPNSSQARKQIFLRSSNTLTKTFMKPKAPQKLRSSTVKRDAVYFKMVANLATISVFKL